MATGLGDSATVDGTTLLARLLDPDEETTDTDDSFNYLEAGMEAGESEEVSSLCSEVSNSSVSNDNDDSDGGSDFVYDPSLPRPSSGPVDTGNFSSDSDREEETDESSSDLLACVHIGHLNVKNGRSGKRVKVYLRLSNLLMT